ncbi:MAG: hypothetical protein GY828_04265 [Candidatus Gracilibacteria bacterium]|nr:hypothetical protein [Candidatus Gracilibacteria bacterium]
MRFIRNKKNLGSFYSYKKWGGVNAAIEAAISQNKVLKAQHPTSKIRRVRKPKEGRHPSAGFNGVGFRKKLDKRRGEFEHFYWVSYKKKDKAAVKTFSLGYTAYDAETQLHAYRTAIQFRKEWDELDEGMDFERYKHWRKNRVYCPNNSKAPPKRRRRKKGEKLPKDM